MVVTVFLRNNSKKNFKKYILIKKDNGITLDFSLQKLTFGK